MTQEEKAYDEANYNNYKSFNELVERLESVKSAIKEHNYGIAMDTLYKPYPEFQIITSTKLKESDERIRDEIVIYIGAKDDISLNTHNRWLSWLEKQGEQKPAWSEEDENMVRYIGDAITCEESAKYLEEKGIDMIKAHRWLEFHKSQFKQEWSEEDDNKINSIKYLLHELDNHNFDNWLKSLKDRINNF